MSIAKLNDNRHRLLLECVAQSFRAATKISAKERWRCGQDLQRQVCSALRASVRFDLTQDPRAYDEVCCAMRTTIVLLRTIVEQGWLKEALGNPLLARWEQLRQQHLPSELRSNIVSGAITPITRDKHHTLPFRTTMPSSANKRSSYSSVRAKRISERSMRITERSMRITERSFTEQSVSGRSKRVTVRSKRISERSMHISERSMRITERCPVDELHTMPITCSLDLVAHLGPTIRTDTIDVTDEMVLECWDY